MTTPPSQRWLNLGLRQPRSELRSRPRRSHSRSPAGTSPHANSGSCLGTSGFDNLRVALNRAVWNRDPCHVKVGESEKIPADTARAWWKALMANAVALVEDAAILARHESPGRAQALLVLAMEELAKARWLYTACEWEWSRPLGLYGQEAAPARPVEVPEGLRSTRRPHAEKLLVAEQFASGLAGFWDSARRHEYYVLPDLEEFDATARQRNLDKQAGLYVDRAGGVVTSPLHISDEGVEEAIRRAAQVIKMQLIEDHTRQQDAPYGDQIDSVQDLHWAILRLAHPEECASFLGRLAESGEHCDRSQERVDSTSSAAEQPGSDD